MLNESRRLYMMSDSELIAFANGLCLNITRDIIQFTTRGVLAADVVSLTALINAFEIFPNDSYYQANVSIAVEKKDNDRLDLTVKVRDVTQCAIIKWGENSPKYKKFGVRNISKLKDNEFFTTCRQVVLTATEYLDDLDDVGLTQDMIDAVEDGADTFETDIEAINTAITQRDIKTVERITKGNEIYNYVTKYCKIGKIIWDDIDEAKYNDYLIYPKVNHNLYKPKNLTAERDIEIPTFVNLAWDEVEDATIYQIFISLTELGTPSNKFQLLNTTSDYSFKAPGIIGKRNHFKIRARNATQTSDYSDEVYVDLTVL